MKAHQTSMFINNGFYTQYCVVCTQHNCELGKGNTALLIHPRNPKDHCKHAFQINPVLGNILGWIWRASCVFVLLMTFLPLPHFLHALLILGGKKIAKNLSFFLSLESAKNCEVLSLFNSSQICMHDTKIRVWEKNSLHYRGSMYS